MRMKGFKKSPLFGRLFPLRLSCLSDHCICTCMWRENLPNSVWEPEEVGILSDSRSVCDRTYAYAVIWKLAKHSRFNEDYFIERNVMKEQKLVKEYCISPTNIIRDVYEKSDVASSQADINKLTMGNIQAIRHGSLWDFLTSSGIQSP